MFNFKNFYILGWSEYSLFRYPASWAGNESLQLFWVFQLKTFIHLQSSSAERERAQLMDGSACVCCNIRGAGICISIHATARRIWNWRWTSNHLRACHFDQLFPREKCIQPTTFPQPMYTTRIAGVFGWLIEGFIFWWERL